MYEFLLWIESFIVKGGKKEKGGEKVAESRGGPVVRDTCVRDQRMTCQEREKKGLTEKNGVFLAILIGDQVELGSGNPNKLGRMKRELGKKILVSLSTSGSGYSVWKNKRR